MDENPLDENKLDENWAQGPAHSSDLKSNPEFLVIRYMKSNICEKITTIIEQKLGYMKLLTKLISTRYRGILAILYKT